MDNRRPEDSPGYAIAVLPFADNSCTPETSASAAGLTEEITYRISLTEGCRAMTLDSEHAWGDPFDNLSAARRDPKVQQIIYGSVQKQGSQFAILVHGRNPRSREVWTEKFQAEPRDGELLKLQKYAASALMARIRPHRSEIRNMEEQVDPTCVAMYPEILSAEALLDTCDPVAIKAALNRLRGLVARSPNSARSFCGIVQCHYLLALLHEPVLAEAMRESRRCAERALEIDNRMGETYAALGCVQVLELSFNDAEHSFLQALELAPDPHPALRQPYAHLLVVLGKLDEAFQQLRMSQSVDPFSGQQKLACARLKYLSGQFEDDTCDPSFINEYGEVPKRARLIQANIDIQLGKKQKAMDSAEEILRQSNGTPVFTAEIAEILGLAGNHPKAESLTQRFDLLDPDALVSKVGQARLSIAIRKPERCQAILAEAFRQKEPQLCTLGVDPRFDPIRSEPFLKDLLSSLKLPNAVAPTMS